MSLSNTDLRELRSFLEGERDTLAKNLSEHGRKVSGDWQGTPKGFEEETDSEPEDAADRMEELATNVALVEELERKYREVEDALKRMDEGTYGIDENTKEPISLERLRANPSARGNV